MPEAPASGMLPFPEIFRTGKKGIDKMLNPVII